MRFRSERRRPGLSDLRRLPVFVLAAIGFWFLAAKARLEPSSRRDIAEARVLSLSFPFTRGYLVRSGSLCTIDWELPLHIPTELL